jgi:hypothetical protein
LKSERPGAFNAEPPTTNEQTGGCPPVPKLPEPSEHRKSIDPEVERLEKAARKIAPGWKIHAPELRRVLSERAENSGKTYEAEKIEALLAGVYFFPSEPKRAMKLAQDLLRADTLMPPLPARADVTVGLGEYARHRDDLENRLYESDRDYWLENADTPIGFLLGVDLSRALRETVESVYYDTELTEKQRAAELGLQPKTLHKRLLRLRRCVEAARVCDVELCDEHLELLLDANLSRDAHALVHDMISGDNRTYEQRDAALGKRPGFSRRLLPEIWRQLAA